MNTTLTVQQDSVIVKLMQAGTALAEAKTIQQTKQVLDVAAAAEIYAKRQQLGEEAIGIAHTVKIDALRKLGEMLQATPRNKGQISRGTKKVQRGNEPTLEQLGLDRKTSSVAQKLAELPAKAFEQVRDGHETIARALAAVTQTKPKQKLKDVDDKQAPTDEIVPVLDPDKYTEIDALRDQVEALQCELAAAHMKDSTEDEKKMHIDLVASLRSEIKLLKVTLSGVKSTRDGFQAENAELHKQVVRQVRELKKIKGQL